MRTRSFIMLLAVTCLFAEGCKKHDEREERYTWSSEAPLTIPFRVRQQRFDKGNLVRNPSFETGRTFTIESARSSFVIDGWQLVGQHVQWVDTRSDSLFEKDEAYSGHRAVKITRTRSYETDEQGEGVISDYIKVIPGNYSLTCYTKLEDVFPVKARLGTRLYDAVELTLQYFDRNKTPIVSKQPFPHIDQSINASFKSLSFANYKHIRSFGWGKVIGKSEYFPFPDGDIPSEAHYVKIFVGLKGKGTMWIDNIEFSYTSHNFSVAERMRDYTDTTYYALEAIVPAPKMYTKMESVNYRHADDNADRQPLIVLPAQPDALAENAAGLIRKALGIGESRVVRKSDSLQIEKSVLVFSLGPTDLFKKNETALPVDDIRPHTQGYFIYSTRNRPNLVYLAGNNSTALYYAALTAVQMFDKKLPIFHNARIVDYPDIANRCFALPQASAGDAFTVIAPAELLQYKFNGAFSAERTGVSYQDNELLRVYQTPRHAKPSDSSLTYMFPDTLRFFPVLHNQQLDYTGCGSAGKWEDHSGKYFYSGSSYFSISTDDADMARFIDCMGASPVFMDNSMQISTSWRHYGGNDPWYPGKVRLFSILEPYNNEAIREHIAQLDTSLFFVNQTAGSELELIRLATAADFMWNMHAYSHDRSLWKVLQSRYGAEAARNLILYADKYGLMLEMLLKLKTTGQLTRNLKGMQQSLAELNALVNAISKQIGTNHRLVRELRSLNDGLKDNMHRLLPTRY